MEFMQGYKTITAILVYLGVSVLGAFGILPENVITELLSQLAVGLGAYGVYDKLGRK